MLLVCGCCASFLNLTAIAFDRYLSIVHPLKYTGLTSERFVHSCIGFNWICALLISLSILLWNNYKTKNGCKLISVIPRQQAIFSSLVSLSLSFSLFYSHLLCVLDCLSLWCWRLFS